MPCTGFIPKAARSIRNPRVNRSGSGISPSPLSSAPLMSSVSPVIQAASAEARKTAAGAISCG